MKTNIKPATVMERTHEGGRAARIDVYSQLRRSVLSCLLFEKEFYEEGIEIAARIEDLADKVDPEKLAALCIEARKDFNLRHVPLLLLCSLIKRGGRIVGETITETISRADELAELVAIYWRKGKRPLSKQMKIGLGLAFRKFPEYALAKYDREGKVRLRDVLFLTHPKPQDKAQKALWKRLVDGNLEPPDTWEVQLSAGKDKKATFERLLREGQLGYLALLRNLRNMAEAKCDQGLIEDALRARKGAEKVLPFRYVAAVRYAPQFAEAINDAFVASVEDIPKFGGTTAVLIDVSGSMDERLSGKSDMQRIDAAAALGTIWPGKKRVFTFSNQLVECMGWKGLPGIDQIVKSQTHGGTQLASAIAGLNHAVEFDRLVVITDEQSHDGISKPKSKANYLINVASNKNGVGYGPNWTHIDGFSESVFRFIYEIEAND